MLRSLFTGISGLAAHQQMLDVASNNIANVNTTGYKSSSAVFEDTLSQTLQGASAGTTADGGTNAKQVGLGVKLAGVVTDFTQGSTQNTGRGLDMLINGDGFFMVSQGGETLYTRQGSYSLDKIGHLVTPAGGMLEDPTGVPLVLTDLTTGTYKSYSIASDGTINAVDPATGTSTTLGQIGLATFANPAGLEKTGDSEYAVSANSGDPIMGAPNTGPFGQITSGALEMSNVNLAAELTNLIIAERGFQANSRTISVSDEVLQTLVQLS